jgi:hypothetical protein
MSTPKPPQERPTYSFKHGGLMRCCLQSLDDEMVRREALGEPLMREGDTLPCKYHDGLGMICKKGYWQWNHE